MTPPAPAVDLRPATPADLPVLARLASREAGSYNWSGHGGAAGLRERLERDDMIGAAGGTLIVLAGEEAAGSVGWRAHHWSTPPHSMAWNIGITLLPEHRGRGVGAQAQRLLCDYLFATTTVNRVEATTNVANLPEQRALVRAGFTLDGVARGAEFLLGSWHDVHLYSRVRSQWSAPDSLRDHLELSPVSAARPSRPAGP